MRLRFLLLLLICANATALDFLPGVMGPKITGPVIRVTGRQDISAESQQGERSDVQQASAFALVPVSSSEKHLLSLSASTQILALDTVQTLPGSARSIPGTLWNVSFGASYLRNYSSGDSSTFSASFGSASDRPFTAGHVNAIGATAVYSHPSGDRKTWLFLLNYSNNRAFMNNIPMPGVAYVFVDESRTFNAVIGIPYLSVRWEFVPSWTVSFSSHITYLRTDLSKRLFGPAQLYAFFEWNQQPYFRSDRTDRSLRIFFDEKKVGLGLKSPLSSFLMADLSFGLSADRRVFEAVSYFKNPSKASLGNALYMALALSFRV